MASIDRVGTFLGFIAESTLGQSSSGFPQWVARLQADKKYVSETEEMKHFGIAEPGYVDWNFDENIVAYMVLFNDKGPLKNYEQLIAATGWTGEDFQDLTGLVNKRLLFRVEENNYNNQVKMQVNWIDTEDAPPERTLKPVDPGTAAKFNAQFLAGLKKPTAPAKPVAAKAVAKAATPAPKPAPAQTTTPAQPSAPAASTASPATAAASATPAPAPAPKSKKTKTPPPPAIPSDAPTGLPAETTKDAAWEYLNEPAVMGANDPSVVADAWIAACNEVGENVDETKFTGEMWSKVRDTVLKDLGVKSPA